MKTKISIWILAAGVLLASCSTPAKTGLLRDLDYNIPEEAIPAPELRLKMDDRISIQVFSEQLELAAPFNTAGVQIEGDASSLLSATYGVDARGDIEFPILGTLHVEGKTLNEVQKMIADEIAQRGYIKDPVVKAELENFTVTVLGELGQMVIPVEGNSMNLLQVMAQLSNDLETAKLPDVMVIRTVDGKREAYRVDFQSKDIYNSPVFYLQQNDIVYVKPRGLKLSNGGDLFLKILSPTISAVSAIAYMLLWSAR
ncbi:MAG: polysaccharide biosynthesis/export family protein [Bacteroidales bacterium]|nr:polysaccharide biosynthesis/export family protein [Bacteroidales bacterium]